MNTSPSPQSPRPWRDWGAANHIGGHEPRRAGRPRFFVYGSAAASSPRDSISSLARRRPASRLDPPNPLRPAIRGTIAAAPSQTTSSPSPTRMSCSRTSRLRRQGGILCGPEAPAARSRESSRGPASVVSLADAVRSYLFNAQLVTLPEGGIALILPAKRARPARSGPGCRRWWPATAPIRRLCVVDVRHPWPMARGPACLRPSRRRRSYTVDPRFLADAGKLDRIAAWSKPGAPNGSPPKTSPIRLRGTDRSGALGAAFDSGPRRARLTLGNHGSAPPVLPRRRKCHATKSAAQQKAAGPPCPQARRNAEE